MEKLSEDLHTDRGACAASSEAIEWMQISVQNLALPNFIKSHLHRSITAKGDDETLIAHLFDYKADEEDERFDEYGPFGLVKLGAEEVVADLNSPPKENSTLFWSTFFIVFNSHKDLGRADHVIFV